MKNYQIYFLVDVDVAELHVLNSHRTETQQTTKKGERRDYSVASSYKKQKTENMYRCAKFKYSTKFTFLLDHPQEIY